MTEADAAALGRALAAAGAAVALVDAAGVATALGAAWAELTGRAEAELVGHPLAALLAPGDGARLDVALAAARGGHPERLDVAVAGRGGAPRWLALQVAAAGDSALVVGVEVTELRRALDQALRGDQVHRELERALLAAHDADEQAARLKSRFLTHVSHELRTPLAGLIGLLDLAGGPAERRDGDLRAAAAAARHVLALVDDLIDVARLEADQLRLTTSELDLGELVDGALATVAAAAQDKGLSLRAELGPGPRRRRGDPLRLRQVLINLLGNAVRHTAHGGVSVRVSAGAGDEVAIAVIDTGPGIDPARAEALFAPFVQGDGPRGAAGLGLAISRELATRMGGRLWVEPAPTGGSAFVVAVPMPAAEEKPAPPPLAVLVVDDHPLGRDVVVRMLERAGHRAVAVDGAAAASAALAAAPFDLILMDVQMPGEDGLAAARRLRAEARRRGAPRVPIVAVSADAGAEAAALAAGADGYAVRPLDVAQLQRLLAAVAAGDLGPPIDHAARLDRAGGGALADELAKLFVERHREIAPPVRAALGAGPAVLAREAHGARGAVGIVCATHAAELCSEIEARVAEPAACAPLVDRLEREIERAAAELAAVLGG